MPEIRITLEFSHPVAFTDGQNLTWVYEAENDYEARLKTSDVMSRFYSVPEHMKSINLRTMGVETWDIIEARYEWLESIPRQLSLFR